jgi:hypothetical protein
VAKRKTAVEQRNQRTLEDHTQTVELTSAAWHYVTPPKTAAGRMSSAAIAKGADTPDSLEAADDEATLVAEP